jgi:hypothetical protein
MTVTVAVARELSLLPTANISVSDTRQKRIHGLNLPQFYLNRQLKY